jgi:glycosyltransferase involved in cell wall biosynthesis
MRAVGGRSGSTGRSPRRMSVLHVAQPTDAGVASYVVAACVDQLARGWEVAVACPDDGDLAHRLAVIGVDRLSWPASRSPGASSLGETTRLRRLVDAARPQLLHLHSSKAGLAGRLASRGGLPTLFQPHCWSWLAVSGAAAATALAWERWAARWTSCYICVGHGEAEHGRKRGLRGRFEVVHNGVDLTRFAPAGPTEQAESRQRLGVPEQVPLAVCVGRVTRQKGQDILAAAWPAVRSACPDAQLALVGAGHLPDPLLGVQPTAGVRFPGTVTDVRPWLAAADLVVLPSRWEGLPLTLLEALAVGRPVVGSDIVGIADVLPADAGSLVPAGDPAALAEAIVARLGRPDRGAAEGAAGARHAARHFDSRRTYHALADLSADLVARTARPDHCARIRSR